MKVTTCLPSSSSSADISSTLFSPVFQNRHAQSRTYDKRTVPTCVSTARLAGENRRQRSQSKPVSYLCFNFLPRFATRLSTYAALMDSAGNHRFRPFHFAPRLHKCPDKSSSEKRMRGLIQRRSPRHTLFFFLSSFDFSSPSPPHVNDWSDWKRIIKCL